MKQRFFIVLLFVFSLNITVNLRPAHADATRTIGSGGDYATLKAAFDAINAGTVTGVITLQLTGSTTETSSAVLNASGAGSASYTSVTLYPTATGLSISGNLSVPLIDLNGADHVTIDGRVNATGLAMDMTIVNTRSNDDNQSTIRFTNDATYNSIKYCRIKGSAYRDNYGILVFSNAATSAGNSYNTIEHNEITNNNGYRPLNTVISTGNSSFPNRNNTISNNNIHDVLNPNINHAFIIKLGIGGDGGQSYNDAWTISGNSFYESESFTITSGNNARFIYIYADGGNNFTISDNYFGGSAPLCGGTWTKGSGNNTFSLMELRVGTATASNIQGNTIKNISFTNTGNNRWWGINLQRGTVNVGTTAGNCYGASDGTGSIIYTANGNGSEFYAFYFQSTNVNAQNNSIGSITVSNANASSATSFYGICFNSNGTACSLSNNTIGSITTSNSINATSASTTDAQKVYGITAIGNSGNLTVSNNTIANLTNGTTNTGTTVYGRIYGIFLNRNTATITGNLIHHLAIANANAASECDQGDPNNTNNPYISAAGIAFANSNNSAQNISGNTINNISNTYASFTGHIAGIYYYGASTASSISGNLIYGLSVNTGSSAASIHGIKTYYGNLTLSNNIIVLGDNSTNRVNGIYESGTSGATSNICFNTIYLKGAPASGSLNSACYYNASNQSMRNIRNNLFINARSNSGASGTHYASYFSGTGGSLTIDYNDYIASGSGGVLGYYGGNRTTLDGWKSATGQDTHSLNLDPGFSVPGGSSATDYIPSSALTAATGTGITTDYGGTTRSLTSPEMGAWEQNNTATWNGSTDTDWSVAGNWSTGSVPTASTNVTIPSGTMNPCHVTRPVSTAAACNNLTIDAGAVLTIDPGKALTVNGTLVNNNGNSGLIIDSDATGTGSLIQHTASVGATVKRYLTGSATLTSGIYHFVSIPVYYSNPTSNLFLGSHLYKLDPTQQDPDNSDHYGLWVNLGSSTTTPLSGNSGYMVYYPAAEHTYSFAGNLNTGLFSPAVSYGGTYTFNLIPNPYPSAINWGASAGWVKSNIGATAWIWNAGSGNYSTLSGPSYVPAGQAIIVMASGEPVLTMNNNACVHHAQAFYKSAKANTLKITAHCNNYHDETFVCLSDSAGSGFDPQLDGFKLWGLKDAPQLWTEKENYRLSINELPLRDEAVIVPLDFKTDYTGEVVLGVSGTDGFEPWLPIRLHDHLSGTLTDLRQNPTYTFVHNPDNTHKRFSLVFGSPTGIGENQPIEGRVRVMDGSILLDIPSMNGSEASVKVFGMQGQVILSIQRMINGTLQFEAPTSAGVYVIAVASRNGDFVTRFVNM